VCVSIDKKFFFQNSIREISYPKARKSYCTVACWFNNAGNLAPPTLIYVRGSTLLVKLFVVKSGPTGYFCNSGLVFRLGYTLQIIIELPAGLLLPLSFLFPTSLSLFDPRHSSERYTVLLFYPLAKKKVN
jgi:hypothetical protein